LNQVIKLVKSTIADRRTQQRFILLEGFCNNSKLEHDEDKLSMRFMDEIFLIEKNIGTVQAIIGL
jgi:hypothetical protein